MMKLFLLFNLVVIANSFTTTTQTTPTTITKTGTTPATKQLAFVPASTSTTATATRYSSTSSSTTKRWTTNNVNNINTNNESNIKSSSISIENIKDKKILVVGGSGRVGGSVVCNLLLNGAKVTVGGTNRESYLTSKKRWKTLYGSTTSIPINDSENDDEFLSFAQLDREDVESVSNVLTSSTTSTSTSNYDLVVHTAGPFQGKVKAPNGVIDASINNGVPYIDVCDDYCTAKAAQSKYNQRAIDANVSCIISTGCWPGVSSLMAKQLSSSILNKHTNDDDIKASDLKLNFSFFTAGSGGAGSTLLVATFLILAEKSLMIVNNRRTEVDAMKEYSTINFGKIVGDKDVAHLNLLETASVHDVLGIGNVKTLFGTAPGFWNVLLGYMAQLPSSLLSNEVIMERLALFSLPIVRVVDYFAGATNAMRVDITCDKDNSIREMALYAHENLEPCVGECVVGFCAALLSNSGCSVVDSGVYFPEEAIDSGVDAAAVLQLASVGAHTLEIESNSGLTKKEMWGTV